MYHPTLNEEIEFTILKFPKGKFPGPDDFSEALHQTFKELILSLHNLI